MEIVKDNHNRVYDWVVEKTGIISPNHLTIAVRDDNIIVAGVIYAKVNNVVYMTMYSESPQWCVPGIITGIIEIGLGLGLIVKVCTSYNNHRANKLLWGLGFHKEAFLRFGRPNGEHELVWSITEKELKQKRWYRNGVFEINR